MNRKEHWLQFSRDMNYLMASREGMSPEIAKFVTDVDAKVESTDTIEITDAEVKRIRELATPGTPWR